MTTIPRAWVLNLEADDQRARGRGWTPSRALLTVIDEQAKKLVATLVRPGDIVLGRDDQHVHGDAYVGEAWSPTERALARMKRAKVRMAKTPAPSVIERVSGRAFAQRLAAVTPCEREVRTDEGDIEGLPDGPTRVSLEHTCAGRGHFNAENREELRAVIERLRAGHARLYVAERVEVIADFALHGWISSDAELLLGAPTEQRVDRRTRAWLDTVTGSDVQLSPAERDALFACARDAAQSLIGEGYFGPFGIDAFRYRDRDGAVRFCARCELNARYTMGWAIGMRSQRDAIDARCGL